MPVDRAAASVSVRLFAALILKVCSCQEGAWGVRVGQGRTKGHMLAGMRWLRPLIVFFCTVPTVASGQMQVACGESEIVVSAASRQEANDTCEAAGRADRKLRKLGLAHEEPLLVEVVEDLEFEAGSCMAYYDAAAEKLQILSEPCLSESPPPASVLPEMPANVLFESLILHELTHAYLDETLDGEPLPRAAHEYLAYAIQVDAFPEAVRKRLLDKANVVPPVTIEELNDSILFMAPARFAASAWMFFQQNGGGADAVTRVLIGQDRFPRSR